MRTKGANTKKLCYNLKIEINDEVIKNKDFTTLKEIADDCGFTYNRVVEMMRGRKKQLSGKYEPKYYINKIEEKNDDIIEEPQSV